MSWLAMAAPILSIVDKVLDRVIPDPEKAAAAKMEVMKLVQTGELAALEADVKLAMGQMEINKVEAASEDNFTRRWRPFIGWICGFALMMQFIVGPFTEFIAALAGHPIKFPELDMGSLLTLLLGMLGLGGMRTYEKVKKSAS